MGLNARWIACLYAKHDAIFMQDDDIVVPAAVVNTLYEEWKKDSEIIHGRFGRKINSNYKYVAQEVFGEVEIVLVKAALFNKMYAFKALNYLFAANNELSAIIKRNGEDIFFNYLVRSITHRKNKSYNVLGQIVVLPDPHAISSKPGHIGERTKIARLCRKEFDIEYGMGVRVGIGKSKLKNVIRNPLPMLYGALRKLRGI